VEANVFGFVKKMKPGEVEELQASSTRCVEVLDKAIDSLANGLELDKVERIVANNPTAISEAAADNSIATEYEKTVTEWCDKTEALLAEKEDSATSDDGGPRTELDYWRSRMGKLNSVIQQLNGEHCRVVLSVLQVSKSRVLKRWKANDNAITDAANEAKDNVKYLHTLDKYIDPLYTGVPSDIVESLPGLLNNIKMMNTIARYYNTAQRMTTLFRKVTEQMIANCRAYVEVGGSLWEQEVPELISRLRVCIDCNRQYQEQYRGVRDALAENPKGKQFDFNENVIFGKFDLFCRRVEKLIDMFSTVEQFTTLSNNDLEGLEGLMTSFFQIVSDFRRKPYDLLDFQMNQFDRDYLEFNANIHELESSLQGFINQSFEHITSTEHALSLLKQFQATLQRDSLKDDLESKFMVIFSNYSTDLETVQRLYEKQKASPPTVRNAPPVTGNVMWARQLMRRIEKPMEQFKENTMLMSTKESKKHVKVYNKIARTIIEFETLWHLAWTKGIEAAKSGLQATLIVRHPATDRLHVNFDREILQLLRETKCLMRMGQEVPESARMVLAQEDKFKLHYNLLSHAIAEYERVMAGILPIVEPLLRPHIAELERVIQPGMLNLTWTSMNIEAYLYAFHAELMRFDDLVVKIKDNVDNRLMRNLKIVSNLELINLPVDESFTLDKFVALQEKHVAEQQAVMVAKNLEVEEGVQDLLGLILGYSFTYTNMTVDQADVQKLQTHFSRQMYQAVLDCTQVSLDAIKRRVGSRVHTGGFLLNERPFFDVNVELQIPNIVMNPPLNEIQEAINRCSRTVLGCSKALKVWDCEVQPGAGKTSVYEVISKDREIVRVVLLLTGAVEGAKRQVYEYLETFTKYNFLWQDDKAGAYKEFMAKDPTLEDFEQELKKYVTYEAEIAHIPARHSIGALSLETAPMKMALKDECQAWKSQYAENLHLQAKEELEEITQWIHDTTRFLKREVTDLEDVRTAMTYLANIREKESTLDMVFGPVEEKYALLARYEVRVPKEETDTVTDLGYSWKKLKKISDDMTERLRAMQSGFRQGLVRNVKMFSVDVVQFRNDFEANGPGVPGLPPMDACERLRKFQRLYEERARKFDSYSAGEQLFGLSITSYPELEKTKMELDLLDKLYGLYTTVLTTVNDYNDTSWIEVQDQANIDLMLKKMEEFQLACKKMPKDLRSWDAFIELKKTVDDFLETLPLVQMLANPAMRQRHWDKLCELTGKTLNVTSDSFKLSTLLDAGLLECQDDVEDIANSAVKEKSIEIKLGELSQDWYIRTLTFGQFKNRGPIVLNGGATGELMEALEEAQMALGSMMASRFITPFKEEASEWIVRLSTISEILEMWIQVQSMWQYLEAVFTSGDIAKQLPQESKRFQGIDKNWVKIMTKANEVPVALNYIYGNDSLKQLLPYMLEQLELCQKALSGYLDQKRAAFPRFFFVADATLLEVLSQGSNPQAIQPHLQSVFDSLVAVTFDKKEKTIIREFESGEGQTVQLYNAVKAEGNIEEWLDRLLKEMCNTLNQIISMAAGDCDVMPTEAFTHKYQAQVSLIGIQFKWTMDSEDALYRAKAEKNIMKETNKRHNQRLTDLVNINMRTDAELKSHGKWTRKKVETMILVDVHQRDVFDELFKKRVKDPEDFEWQKQARFYWRHDLDEAQVSVADVDFKYCCEYLGVKDRLVITPLTDRCYVTLSQALGMFLGGAPAGPAGTGKTETVKDMGCTLGKYVVVTNCSDQMDYRALGGIYKGLAMSGCWGCFDEFNRIDLEVLSVAAQQVGCVLTAIREQRETFQFTDGHVVACNKEVGYFITMNPGYAGRQELPENLKSLHRGVTMMVPDREIIMKVKLIGSGYVYAPMLAKKFNVLYRLCEEQLSKQAHYDFGLRNILAVLRTAGSGRRTLTDISEKGETVLLMRTLRDMNLSKFVAEDVPLFLALIDDLFPGIKAEKAKHPLVEPVVAKIIKEFGLQMHMDWVAKIVQVYEMCLVRHSLMAVGPSGVGKTRIVEVLTKALSQAVPLADTVEPMIGQPHRTQTLNPKAITSPQMFGALDIIANEWTEGIFAQLWRKANKDKKNFTWLILDGPVDAIWIENMNTVMDDNKILTLANNDRIPMLRPNVTLHFEVEDLRNASPATVSRAGIIYISEADLGWKPYVASYVAERAKDGEMLKALFDKFADETLTFVKRECRPKMAIADISLMTTCSVLLTALLGDLTDAPSEDALERFFLYALMWSAAGVLESEDRLKVDSFLRNMTKNLPDAQAPDSAFEFVVDDSSSTYDWVHWGSRIPQWSYTGSNLALEFASLLIPTIDSVRTEYNMELSIKQSRPVILVGGPGTAKTASILQVLDKKDPATTSFKKLSFSSATTPLIFQRTIEGCIEKRQGRTYGPPGGKKMIVFIDDFSMPEINTWGDQITLEIVRQLIEQVGLYNLDKPGEWKNVVDLLVLGAMLHPGGGKNDIPNRAKRHFHVMNVTLPSVASINQIFGSMIRAKFVPDDPNKRADVWECSENLVTITIDIWNMVKSKMLPTPAKFHYIFNLRDLSRVFQGVFMADVHETVKSETVLLQLWRHECMRVFSDKLVDHKDKSWFTQAIDKVIEGQFGAEKAALVKEDRYFCEFLRDGAEDKETGEVGPAPKVYELIPTVDVVREKAQEYLAKFNDQFKLLKTDLVFFHDCIEHLLRVSRVFAMSRGCALLVGVGGSGKQSLTRLAAYISTAQLFQITVTRSYSANNLLEDFKPLYRRAGVLGKPVCFLFTDKEIKDEGFLEYVNIFLNTGELPNLFPRDELDVILGEMGPVYESVHKGAEPTQDQLWTMFIERVRTNLHLSLCFSPVGAKFRNRAQAFPGLINGCTIDWFLPWPEQALADVATALVGGFNRLKGEAGVKDKLISHMAFVHDAMSRSTVEYFESYRRNVYVTPKSYLGFIDEYKKVYVQKLDHIEGLAENINTGLSKLLDAAKDVEKMKIELKEKEKTLVVAQEKSAILLQDITASTAKAEKKKAEVQTVKDTLAGEAHVIAMQKDTVERDLEAAKPMLQEAEDALKMITAKDIGLLKSFKQPPDLVKRVFDVVLMLFNNNVQPAKAVEVELKSGKRTQLEASWKEASTMMGDTSFLQKVMDFDKDLTNDETVELLHPYTTAPDFTPEDAKKVALALAGLCTWSRAMTLYVDIAKVVKPKMLALKQAEAKLKSANAKLAKAQGELDTVQADLDKMQASFDEAMAHKQALQEDADATTKKMDAANRLINGLSGERKRWGEQSEAFDNEIRRLAGDVSLACAFIGYVGPYNASFREMLQKDRFYADCKQRGVPVTEDLRVSTFLVDEGTIGDWTLEGLPTDELSVQNGIMVTRSQKWPLMIDPQSQGLGWIKNREVKNQLKVTNLLEKRFRNVLEDSMAFGTPLLVENVTEDIDPVLDPVFNKEIQRKGRNLIIQLSDKECEYSETFSLFLCSKLANPHFTPELFAQLTIINFTVTMDGLEQQLLGRVLQKERAELEDQKMKLVEEVNSNQKTLKGLEDNLLYKLANSTGNLLDDVELIEVLQKTKTTGVEVQEKLANAAETDKRISGAREEYRPVATRGALLYFLVVDMAAINNMYMVSLQQFLELFDYSIDCSEKAPLAAKRILNIIEYLTFYVTCYMQRGLFTRHKSVWVLMLAMKVETVGDRLSANYVGNLLKGGGALDPKSERAKPHEWMPEGVWMNCLAVSRTVQMLRDMPESLTNARTAEEWKAWYDHDAPETQEIPEFNDRLDKFERMLVVRALREDRALLSAQEYVSGTLGARYADSRPLDLAALVEESTTRVPAIALLSQGADPTGPIVDLAKKRKRQVLMISMGQGQEPAARKLLNTGIASGDWVLLQNCHLGLGFMLEVEQFMLRLEVEPVETFRLWISAEPHPKFPIGLLQMSIKITNEAPAGIKAGLKNSYAWVNQDMLDSVSQPQWRSMLYALCFMHTIVQERRKFGPLGFNVPYEFNQSDLAASVQYMQNHLSDVESKKRPVDWIAVNYMVCDVQYGGRITDDWDRRLFNTYGKAWLTQICLDPAFEFYKGMPGKYIIPANRPGHPGTEIDHFRRYIETLPLVDDPEIFGLHSNADLAYRSAQTKVTLDTILDIQPKEGGGGGGLTREEIVLKMVEDLQSKLPPDYRSDDVVQGIKALGGMGKPLNICLKQEIDKLQQLLKVVRTMLANLKLAIAGTIVMSPELIDAVDALFMARVPGTWTKVSQLISPNMGVWFANILKRAEQFTAWLKNGRPLCFWLLGFFNPTGFLTANRQDVCRKHAKDNWALDDVVDHSEVLKQDRDDVRKGPEEGIYIYGLYLDGAKWEKGKDRLTDSDPKVLFSPLPVLWITGAQAGGKSSKDSHYTCPVYKAPRRTGLNFITSVDLRIDDLPSKWTLRGVCLLTSTD
jgi:dynein heavy chain